MYFEDLDLSDNILDALYDMRFEKCTPIQEHTIPPILEGRDVLGIAQTGTGKTAAYLLPILSLLDDGCYVSGSYGACNRQPAFSRDHINCVIMSPTRELAQQIDQAMQGFGYYLDDISSVPVYGGNDGNRFSQEQIAMRAGADILIATPGRLISHMQLGNLDLSRCAFFVLDEADRMLDMGFSDDIMLIAKQLPQTCQTIMFSATMPDKIERLARTLLHDHVEVKLAVSKPAERICQSAYICYEKQKLRIIEHIFTETPPQRVILFAGKKTTVKDIAARLSAMKINCGAMHSDLSQAERDEIMFRFKAGQIDVLVATDIVSRGIDIDDIQLVVNYDVPHDAEDYVHRVGRTARANSDGRAVTLVGEREQTALALIEQFLEIDLPKRQVPSTLGSTPDYRPVLRTEAKRKTAAGRHRSKGSAEKKRAKHTAQGERTHKAKCHTATGQTRSSKHANKHKSNSAAAE